MLLLTSNEYDINQTNNLKMKKWSSNAIEALEADYLYLEKSQLPDAGMGLYTAIDIYKDEIIAVFIGEIITTEQARELAISNEDQYFINMVNGSILDCKNVAGFAKYANDCKGTMNAKFNNCSKIIMDERNNIAIVATRKIKMGSEIFCDYGKKYWLKHMKD